MLSGRSHASLVAAGAASETARVAAEEHDLCPVEADLQLVPGRDLHVEVDQFPHELGQAAR